MKTFRLFFIALAVICPLIIQSCQGTRKTAISCPEFSVRKSSFKAYHPKKVIKHHTALNNKFTSASKHKYRNNENIDAVTAIPVVTYTEAVDGTASYEMGLLASADNIASPAIGFTQLPVVYSDINYVSYYQSKYDSLQPACDTIFLRSGDFLTGKVEEIGQYEIKYRKCSNLTGPVITLKLSDISSIKYPNGTMDTFNNPIEIRPAPVNLTGVNSAPGRLEGLGIAGFVAGLVGIFVASIPLGLIAIIFGTISLSKIKRNPQKHKGKGFAIVSLILGLIEVIGMLIILNSI